MRILTSWSALYLLGPVTVWSNNKQGSLLHYAVTLTAERPEHTDLTFFSCKSARKKADEMVKHMKAGGAKCKNIS